MSTFFIKYLNKWNYDIGNPQGNSCLGLNITDIICVTGYVFIVIYTVWSSNMDFLTYIATAILSFRTLVKFWIKQNEIKKCNNSTTITYNTLFVIYFLTTFFLIVCFLATSIIDKEIGPWSKLFLSFYYLVFFVIEFTEIIVRCFDAKPHIYDR